MRPTIARAALCGLLAAAIPVSFWIGDRADRLLRTVHLARPLASSIPLDHRGWRGRDDPVQDEILRTTKVDDHLNRQYQDADGRHVLLYIAFHGNKQRGMDTWYHNPTICMPAAGFELVDTRLSSETLTDAAREIPVCRYVFARGEERRSVLTFFKVDEEFLDQSPRNKPFWTLLERVTPQFDDSPGTFVQVQIVAPVVDRDEYAAAEVQSRFLHDFGLPILRSLEVGARE